MNVVGATVHTHAYHVAMVSSVCAAGLSYLVLVALMIVAGYSRASHGAAWPRVRSRTTTTLVLAALTGLLASLPFALPGGTHGVASFLLRELVYASATALGALGFAAMMAHIATSEIASGDYEPGDSGIFGRRSGFRINPTTGLPMNGMLDWAGNWYGCDSHSSTLRTVAGRIEPR
jgi:hypothetical protein